MTGLTDYHARYLAHELTRRHASDSIEKLAAVLADAQVDLNPHQIDAALFAFQSPFSKGAILADEVGLGKTIEAGLLLAQKWAERKRRLLVILPANLRKQWSQELEDKFFLPSAILETASFNDAIRRGNLNPFQQDAIILCSYQFARTKEPYLRQTSWDLVVVDEAHRLRNVYKGSSKIALAIKGAVAPFPKVLLTATPLQNSLLELYGLVSIVDEYAFGDVDGFRARFSRAQSEADFAELRSRLAPICKRTLRRQVLEYVKYTERRALVQEFEPNEDELRLYHLVSAYLQRETLFALPASQRQLVTLVLRKLLASSSFAIAGTLKGMVNRLETAVASQERIGTAPDELPMDWEPFDELADEWEGDGEDGSASPTRRLTPEELDALKKELEELRQYHELATSIARNSKGGVLLQALRAGFEAAAIAQTRGAEAPLQRKAVIFTESRRTQQYLFELLEKTEFGGKVMLFNGVNNDPTAKAIYRAWLERHKGTDRISGSPTADMRAALVEHFREGAEILIATEAAAEGINLQFCNLVVNYDLPWNPQRIEQRIGRCHRYGQKYDVVVVNFLNKKNAADRRVYELLDEKFRLFSGIFGASDEVLGAVESGVDFEKRIADIVQRCRTPEQIQFEFDRLQDELEEQISRGQREARDKLLDNFDQEVIEKVRITSGEVLDRYTTRLWRLTSYLMRDHAHFDAENHQFELHDNPFPPEAIHPGPYRMGPRSDEANTYRAGHPLALRVLSLGRDLPTPPAAVRFRRDLGPRIAALDPLAGCDGWLTCISVTVEGMETEDALLLAGMTDNGVALDDGQCRRLFDLPGEAAGMVEPPAHVVAELAAATASQQETLLQELAERNGRWFDVEMDKLDHWAEDRRAALKGELEDLDQALKTARKAAREGGTMPEKLARQREVRALESKRDAAWKSFDSASQDLERRKDALLEETARRLAQSATRSPLFLIRWSLA